MRTVLLMGSLVLGVGLAACDRGGKEGEACYTGTDASSDCGEGLQCVQCGKTPTCERVDGFDGDMARVDGKTCNRVKDIRDEGDIKRGQDQGDW